MEDAVVRLVPGHSLGGPGPARQTIEEPPTEPIIAVAKPRRRKAPKR